MAAGSEVPSLPSLHSPGSRASKWVMGIGLGVVIILIAAGVLYGYQYFSGKPAPVNLPPLGGKKEVSKVTIKSEYKNPFDQQNQYVNPFAEFKSPFTSLQK